MARYPSLRRPIEGYDELPTDFRRLLANAKRNYRAWEVADLITNHGRDGAMAIMTQAENRIGLTYEYY